MGLSRRRDPGPARMEAAETAFENNQLVRAVRLFADNGQKEMAVPLLGSFANSFKTGGELVLAARLAQPLDAHHLAISIADAAERRGFPLDLFNFPKDGLPSKQLASMDKAAIYAIARQESRFQVDAVSSAGARGLMQLMPGTAKETAGKIGVSYSQSRLTSDGEYNALLGSTYLKGQLDSFNGSLVLATGRLQRWRRERKEVDQHVRRPAFRSHRPGRMGGVILFQETLGKYVQRVVGNYRSTGPGWERAISASARHSAKDSRLGHCHLCRVFETEKSATFPESAPVPPLASGRRSADLSMDVCHPRMVPEDDRSYVNLPVSRYGVAAGRRIDCRACIGPAHYRTCPPLCVPGYHRNMSDFSEFANHFHRQFGEDWPVVLVDLKGRGRPPDRGDKARYVSTLDCARSRRDHRGPGARGGHLRRTGLWRAGGDGAGCASARPHRGSAADRRRTGFRPAWPGAAEEQPAGARRAPQRAGA